MKTSRVQTLILLLISLSLPACNTDREKPHHDARKVTVTTVQSNAVTVTQPYVCQINSHHHIEVRAPEAGYLEAIQISEGQRVLRDDLLFQVRPHSKKEKLDTENAGKVVSIKAPFDGIVDRLPRQQGSLVLKGEALTTLSDNSLMWVYFKVPEARYFEYKSIKLDQHKDDLKIELVLANGNKFDQLGQLGAIGAKFNAGSVALRADFPNPGHLLRHGQTGTVLIHRTLKNALVVPQQAVFENLDKRYVYVIDKADVAHQREILIQNELEDIFVVKSGVHVDDKIVLEGVRHVRDGDKVNYEDRQPKKVAAIVK